MQAGDQLVERERLDQIIVGAGVQRLDAVGYLVARRQHQHARAAAAGGQAAQHADAVQPRQHQVEHHQLVVVAAEEGAGFHPVAGRVHIEAGTLQAMLQGLAQALGVFHQQQFHGTSRIGSVQA